MTGNIAANEKLVEVKTKATRVFFIGPTGFEMSRVSEKVPIGSVVFAQTYPQWSYWIAEDNRLVQCDEESASKYLAKRLLSYIIEFDILPKNVFLRKIKKKFAEFDLELRTDNKFDQYNVFRYILRLEEHEVPGTIVGFAGGFKRKSTSSKWWIETDPSGRASCRECGQKITKGSKRFARRYWESTMKKHIKCITKRDIGKTKIESISGFHSLEEDEKKWLRRTFTMKDKTWKSALSMPNIELNSLDYPALLQIQGKLLERMDCGIGNVDELILKNIRKELPSTELAEYRHINMPFPEMRKRIIDIAIKAAEKQLANNGTTIFFYLEKWTYYPELVKLIPQVLDLRKKEMKTVVLSKTKDRIDLRPLWWTHYGYSILRLGHRHAGASAKTIDRILKLFDNIDVKIEIEEDIDIKIPTKMSEAMMNYVLYSGTGKKKYNAE